MFEILCFYSDILPLRLMADAPVPDIIWWRSFQNIFIDNREIINATRWSSFETSTNKILKWKKKRNEKSRLRIANGSDKKMNFSKEIILQIWNQSNVLIKVWMELDCWSSRPKIRSLIQQTRNSIVRLADQIKLLIQQTKNCGLVVSTPAWDGTGCEFDSWQCRIYIQCSLSLRLLGSLRGSLGTYGLTHKLC